MEKNYSAEARTYNGNVAINRQDFWNSRHKCVTENLLKRWKSEGMMEKIKSFKSERKELSDILGVKDNNI